MLWTDIFSNTRIVDAKKIIGVKQFADLIDKRILSPRAAKANRIHTIGVPPMQSMIESQILGLVIGPSP